MEWRAGMIRRREEKKGLGRLGMGGGGRVCVGLE